MVQWVELMPSPDWMCRSEVLLPKLRQFLNDDRFEVRPVTLSGLIEALHSERTPVRRYTMDDVFHGMSLGKNGDDLRRRSFLGERTILAAEAISAFAGLFGRPYAGWDVYPDWELDEAWRELLAAQHHDNDECEGLCGAIGRTSYARAQALAEGVLDRTLRLVADRAASVAGELVVFNQLGWPRDIVVDDEGAGRRTIVPQVPAFGVARGPGLETEPAAIEHAPRTLTLRSREVTVIVDLESGVVDQIISPVFPDGALHPGQSVGTLEMIRDGRPEIFSLADVRVEEALGHPVVYIDRRGEDGAAVHLTIALAPLDGGVDLSITADGLPPPDPRMHAGLQTAITPAFSFTLLHDTPYAIAPLEANASHRRKYPTGDWMTSPQVFERIVRPFTAQSLVDLLDTGADRGLLYLHDGSQAFFRTDAGIRNLLTMNDPWDESYFLDRLRARIRLIPHGALTYADRARLAAEFNARPLWRRAVAPLGDVPAPTGGLRLEARSVLATAFHRECARAGEHLPDWAGHAMERPYVVRLAEFDGVGERVTLHVPGRVRAAARTNLLGEHEAALKFSGPSADSDGTAWSTVRLEVGPHEIVTLMLDLERGRKQPRDLDAHRRVWATVHREGVV